VYSVIWVRDHGIRLVIITESAPEPEIVTAQMRRGIGSGTADVRPRASRVRTPLPLAALEIPAIHAFSPPRRARLDAAARRIGA
jgi:hypothetical protein